MSESNQLTPQQQRIMDEDLTYLKEMYIHESEGKRFLGNENKAYNIEWQIKESEFVKDWLIQFALGNDTGINYFNITKWGKHTNRGQGLVEVIADDSTSDKTTSLFIIPPLMAVNMNNQDYQLIRRAIMMINFNMVDEQNTRIKDSNKPIADELASLLENKRIPIPDNVPGWFYEKHGVVPLVEQQCFFIRDVINADKPYPHEDYYRLRDILYRKFRKEGISLEEKQFADSMSRNNIEWEEVKENSASNSTNVEENDGYDPLSC